MRNLKLPIYIEQRARDVIFALLCGVKLRLSAPQLLELISEVRGVLDKRRLPETWDRLLTALERALSSGVAIDETVLEMIFAEAGLMDSYPEILLQLQQRPFAPDRERVRGLAREYLQALQWKDVRAFAHQLSQAIDSLDFDRAGELVAFESLRLQEQIGETRGREKPAITPETPRELIARAGKDTPWIWRGIIPARHVVLLAGREKGRGGKSTLLFGLISHILRGEPFLGREVTPQRILYISEETRDTVKDKLVAFAIEDTDALLLLTRESFPGGTRGALHRHLRDIEKIVESHNISLVIIDTLQSFTAFRGEGENRTGDIQAEIAPIISLSARGVGVVAVHHHNKYEGEPRGGTALTGAVDVVVNLTRKGGEHAHNRRVLEWEGRFGISALEYEYDPDTYTFHYHGTPEQAESKLIQQAIVDLLSKSPEPLTEKEIRESLQVAQQRISDALRTLLNAGAVIRHGRGGKGDPYRYTLPDAGGDDSPSGFYRFTDPIPPVDGKTEFEPDPHGGAVKSAVKSADPSHHSPPDQDFTAGAVKPTVKSDLGVVAIESRAHGNTDTSGEAVKSAVKSARDLSSESPQKDFTVDQGVGIGKTVKSETHPPDAHSGTALVDAICEEFPGAFVLDDDETVEALLQLWASDALFPAEPAELETARALWREARRRGFPRLEVPDYATIDAGVQSWRVAFERMALTPAAGVALEALQGVV